MAVLLRPAAEQGVGNLDEDARTVAQQRIGADRSAVIEVFEDLQRLGDDRMAFLPTDMGDEAHSAGIVLISRIVQALSLGKLHSFHRPQARQSLPRKPNANRRAA